MGKFCISNCGKFIRFWYVSCYPSLHVYCCFKFSSQFAGLPGRSLFLIMKKNSLAKRVSSSDLITINLGNSFISFSKSHPARFHLGFLFVFTMLFFH